MQPIWKGTVSFGLVTVPVRLYAATEDRGVAFHQVHSVDGARVQYQRVCSACGEEVAFAELAKGYELASGEVVVLTDDDLAELPLPTARTIELLAFVPAGQLDPVALARGYYLEPEPVGRKPYALLRDALERSGRVGLAKVALRTKETLAVLRPRGSTLVLQTMVWPDEVRSPRFRLDEGAAVTPAEREVADALVEAMAADFDPGEHTDAYRAAVLALVDAKAGGAGAAPAAATAPDRGLDLISALEASVRAAQERRGPADGSGEVPRPRGPGAARRPGAGSGRRG